LIQALPTSLKLIVEFLDSNISRMNRKSIGRHVLSTLLSLLLCSSVFGETESDSAMWSGGLFLWQTDSKLNFSGEYQVRLDQNMSALSSHFLEGMSYKKAGRSLLFNAGYRYTLRPDHDEHRLYIGGFWDMTRDRHSVVDDPGRVRIVLQVGYQHDFNVSIDDQFMDSDSIRWILIASHQASEKIRPFLIAGVLTSWNDAYSFGADKMRLGGGIAVTIGSRSRLRTQYIFERSFFRTPMKNTNIVWLRYEADFGIP
jgi:hypothetical protein